MTDAAPALPAERIRCMEVWGGNLRIQKFVQVTGLDVWVASKPLGDDEAGGDVYYISSCAGGRLTRILLADVSGHGRQVADVAGHLRDLMRTNIDIADHRRFVADMNSQFEAHAASETFATAVISSFLAPVRSLLVCNAGHPAPLVYQQASGRWQHLERLTAEVDRPRAEPAGLPLGILPHTDYEQRKIKLRPGDAVLCFTDAFIEAVRPDGSLLGVDGLRELADKATPFAGGDDLMARLIDSVRALHPENLHQDDATLVLFRATGVRFHLRDYFLAPFRHLFSRVSDACRIVAPRTRDVE